MVPALFFAIATQEVLAAILFGIAFVLRPKEREHAAASLFCLAALAHATALSGGAGLVAGLALLVALALAVHHGFMHATRMPSRRALALIYGCFGGCAALALTACAASGRERWESAVVLALASGAASLASGLAAQAYLRGRRVALIVAIGGAVLFATLVNDAAVSLGHLETPHLGDVGLLAYVLGLVLTRASEAASLRNELDRRSSELERSASESRRVHEQLAAAEEQLVQKEQLAVVGELAAVIAHEVRNPLAIIGNAVAGLRKEAISREDHETLLEILDEEASRLNRLVTDLLRYARPVNVQRAHFLVSDLLDRSVGHVRAPDKGIEAALKVECKEARIWGDANLLRQVFDNLVDNAVQAMGGGGKLTVRLRTSSANGVDGLAVDIVDTGEGMDTHIRSRARDPFFTTRPSGTGLGLAIVDRIVEAHNGHLSIDSYAGEGTTVTVFLPFGSPPSEPPPRPTASVQGEARQAPPPS